MLSQIGRLRVVPALMMPVLWSAAYARWQFETVSIWHALVLLFTFGALALAVNFLGAYLDFQRHIDLDGRPKGHAAGEPAIATKPDRKNLSSMFDGYDWLQQGILHSPTFLSFGLMALTMYALSTLWIGFFVGWPFWFFAASSGLLCGLALWPVIRYSRHLWWIGEVTFWAGIGVVPFLGTYHALTGTVSQSTLWIAAAAATFSWLAHQSYSFYSWHRDWRLRKRTLVVVFGPERALDASAICAVSGFIMLILLMATSSLPVWTIAVLGALPLFLRAFARTRVWPFSRQAGIATVEYAINATVVAGLLWLLALWLA